MSYKNVVLVENIKKTKQRYIDKGKKYYFCTIILQLNNELLIHFA